jgi:hypothetical protein
MRTAGGDLRRWFAGTFSLSLNTGIWTATFRANPWYSAMAMKAVVDVAGPCDFSSSFNQVQASEFDCGEVKIVDLGGSNKQSRGGVMNRRSRFYELEAEACNVLIHFCDQDWRWDLSSTSMRFFKQANPMRKLDVGLDFDEYHAQAVALGSLL